MSLGHPVAVLPIGYVCKVHILMEEGIPLSKYASWGLYVFIFSVCWVLLVLFHGSRQYTATRCNTLQRVSPSLSMHVLGCMFCMFSFFQCVGCCLSFFTVVALAIGYVCKVNISGVRLHVERLVYRLGALVCRVQLSCFMCCRMVMQNGAMCCRMVQCVAACVAEWCNVLLFVLQNGAMRCCPVSC